MLNKYYESVETHRRLVWQVGNVLGVDTQQLLEHDLSKYSREEFEPYAQSFYGDRGKEGVYLNFQVAWQHHIRYNPHHWKHWILRDMVYPVVTGDNIDSNKTIPMPHKYILEMVTDWQAAEIQYQGHQTMSKWLNTNFDKMILHRETRQQVIEVLETLGYEHYNDLNSESKFESEFIHTYNQNPIALQIEEIAEDYRMR